jgi:tricorn protease interacting factor F2/3
MEKPECEAEVGKLMSLRINPDRRGFYSVDNQGLDAIILGSQPSAYDRWGIIFDAFLSLLSGSMSFNKYLSSLRRFGDEDDTVPAQEISDQTMLLYTLAPSKVVEISKEFHRKLFDRFKNRSDPSGLVLRVNLASRLAVMDPKFATTLAQEFKEFAKVAPDMRSAVAIAYARSTNDFDGLISAYRKSDSDEDKVRILAAMTLFSDERLVAKTLEFALSEEVKRQDIIAAVSGAAQNPHVRGMVWDWLKSKIGKLQELYSGTGLMSSILASIVPVICLGRAAEAETYFSEHAIPDAGVGIKVGLEKLRVYDRLMEEILR